MVTTSLRTRLPASISALGGGLGNRLRLPVCIPLVALLLALCGCASRPTSIRGQSFPLRASSGEAATLDQLTQRHDATVLVFWSGGCPCVRRYQQRIDGLLDRYPAERVRVVGISSNAGESFDQVLRIAADRAVRIPIYRDEGGQLARAVGARTTPTVAVLDRQGNIRFLGWIDNERAPGESGREAWLDDALAGILGSHDFQSRTPTYGCAITRSLFQSSSSCCSQSPTSRSSP